MTARGTLGLVGLCAALALYLVLMDPPSAGGPQPAPLLATPVDTLALVDVAWPDARLVARRVDGRWQRPDGSPLPSGLVEDFLGTLATLRPTDGFEGAGDRPSDYGLDGDAVTVLMETIDRAQLRLDVGDRNPAWTGVYVRRGGSDAPVLVGGLLHWELEKLHHAAAR